MLGFKRRKQVREDAEKYFNIMSDMHQAYRWLNGEAAETVQWLLEMHRDKWRGIHEPPISKMPPDISDFRAYLYAKRGTQP